MFIPPETKVGGPRLGSVDRLVGLQSGVWLWNGLQDTTVPYASQQVQQRYRLSGAVKAVQAVHPAELH
ncbi:hypothetical protein BsWGS_02133 [Bradybaena similaris]